MIFRFDQWNLFDIWNSAFEIFSPWETMDDREINRLFEKIKRGYSQVPKGAEAVFSMLVSTTLEHRDRLKDRHGIILTVEDVRVALDWLTQFMESQQVPATNNAVRWELLITWIEALRAPEKYSGSVK